MAKRKKAKKSIAVKIDAATKKEIVALRKQGYGVFIARDGSIQKFKLHP
jgi:hypothetical protein